MEMVTAVSLKGALLESAKEVFETMVFMALEECAEEAPPAEETQQLTCLLGSITFKGNLQGCLCVCCSVDCAKVIAANMLGMDPGEPLSEHDLNDAIGEIANMVMGAVKSRVQDDVGCIEVSIPSVVQGRELRNSLGDGVGLIRVRMSVEDEHAVGFSLLYREAGR